MNGKKYTILCLAILFAFGAAAAVGRGAAGALSAPRLGSMTPAGEAPAVDLGAPGTVFRYEQTFGETGVAYLADEDHLYAPIGVGLDGDGNLWVAEGDGARALKYSGDGAFLMSIGVAGLTYIADETSFTGPTDVAVDSDGNLWVTDMNAARVVKFDPAGNYLTQLGVTLEAGADNNHFDNPVGVAFDSAGDIYVSDINNHRIQVFDSSGVYSMTLGVTGEPGTGNDHFNSPRRIAIDEADTLYVTDLGNQRVQVFDAGYNYLATLGETGVPGWDNDHFNNPTGVAVDANYIYVADRDNHRVQVFDRETYVYEDTLGGFGSGDYQFNTPRDVAVDLDDNLYVADALNHRVQKYNSSLVYVRTFGITGVPYLTDGYHYNQPNKVAVDANGNIAILEDEGRGHRLVKLNPSGATLFTIGEAGVAGGDNDHFSDARGVAFDTDGNIYVGDCANHRVQIFSSGGVYSATLGSYGQEDDQFDCPTGLAFDSSGNLYVADSGNQRLQIFDSSLVYSDTLGETGVPGDDDAHFSWPQDVDVDADGKIYVADTFNERVQVFDNSLEWEMTLGVTGECGYDFEHFCTPESVAVDSTGNVYVAEYWNPRVQVFDPDGAYLTTIGGNWGDLSSQFRHLLGVAVDTAGNVYIPDLLNHRVQKFAPGVPDWQQVNINGFGGPYTNGIPALEVFGGQLYAGTSTSWQAGEGPRVYRSSDGIAWSPVSEPGFGYYTATNSTIIDLAVFDGQLYAGVGWGGFPGQVWRSPDGATWEPVDTEGFGDGRNEAVGSFAVYKGLLYASTRNSESGAQIWRSSSGKAGDWTQVAPDEPGTEDTHGVTGFAVFQGSLYAAVEAEPGVPMQVWRSANGSAWDTVVADGFGVADNYSTGGFAAFGGYLYLGTLNDVTGAQLWRSADGTTWEQAVGDGFGDAGNDKIEMLTVFAGRLYAGVNNDAAGLKILRSSNGTAWEQVNPDGFGDSNNWALLWSNSTTKFQSRLHIGTWNLANGGEVWRYELEEKSLYLPIITH